MARGHIRQRSKNHPDRWTIYIYLGIDPASGKKRYRTEVFRGTRREAQIRLTQLQAEMDRGENVEPSRQRVEDFLRFWLHDYAEVRVRPRTLQGYRGLLERYIIPALGHMRVDRLSPLDIQAFEGGCLRSGLSPRTVLHCHRVVSQALRWGVRMQVLARNPCDLVDPPRPQRYQARYLDWDEVRVLLAASEGTSYHSLVRFDLLTGLRRSELLGLRWQDVDLERASISVVQTLTQLDRGELAFGPPKSGRSRAVSLPDPAVRILSSILESGGGKGPVQPGDVVFQGPGGALLMPDTVTQAFGRIARRAGFKGLRFHDLRHTHATLLLSEGVNLKVVSERLGHAGIQITADLYAHVTPTIQREAAIKLSEKFDLLAGLDLQKDLQVG